MKTHLKILTLFFTLGLISVSWAQNPPTTCTIKSYNGHYITAVHGGGRTTNVLHTIRKKWKPWDLFTLTYLGGGSSYGIKTYNRQYLSAQGGGGRITDVIRSDRTQLSDWEKFKLIPLGNDLYAIQTFNGNYLTAVGGGGRTTDVIHSDATTIGNWEMWYFNCWIR